MNILYISKLDGNKWQGPNQSVPKQIEAQSIYDNVFWYNINDILKDEWTESFQCYNTLKYPNITLKDLPKPFNKPDIVIFEGVYEYPFCKIIYEIWDNNIPYIIIPRSALTKQAQSNKKIKKKLGNIIFFNKFIKRADGIQYLTKDEFLNSGEKWNKKNIIIPNGIDEKNKQKIYKEYSELKGIFIGRIDTYQKGLDLLIESCNLIKADLKRKKCKISLYGPDRYNSKEGLNKLIIDNKLEEIIQLKDGVFDKEKEQIQLDSDFFIMTSRFEGHPMGLIEALSYGLPCIVSKGSNMSEEIKEFDAGWICDNDVYSISDALQDLLNDSQNLQNKGNNAKKLSKKYDWKTIAKISSEKYKEILRE